ncbi:hypothetical protein SDC9_118605 [bioreactor metagenome]|uniref:Uncharacterized protein n=1 Tax=bioreactor metagenome TaxID=1076179 RepID=A0A645C349_9ZZZZ
MILNAGRGCKPFERAHLLARPETAACHRTKRHPIRRIFRQIEFTLLEYNLIGIADKQIAQTAYRKAAGGFDLAGIAEKAEVNRVLPHDCVEL